MSGAKREAGSSKPVGLVTGGGRGIGLELVRLWVHRGALPVVVDYDPDAEAHVAKACGLGPGFYACYPADVRGFDRAQEIVDDVMQRFGRLDYVVLCAGITRDRVSWKMSEAEWDEVLAVDLKGAFNYARAAAPVMRERGSGRLVFVSSINAMRGKFGQCNYAAAKAGMIGLARSLALELGPYGVTANVVAPGMTRTTMTANLSANLVERAREEAALKRVAEPEDVAQAVDFLCRAEARHITGVVLHVDGGQTLMAGAG